MPIAISLATASTEQQWQPASWEDYQVYRDTPGSEQNSLYFDHDRLLITDMGWEGIAHASICDLFTMLLFVWFSQGAGNSFSSLGRCLLEKPPLQAGAPDLVVYVGDNYPRWQSGEKQRIDLHQWRVPDLVGEVSDTTLAIDLDEMKQIYAEMGIPEYWVIDIRGKRVFAFQLQDNGRYITAAQSRTLAGLPISLLEATLGRLEQESNGSVALWFSQQIAELKLA